MPRMKKTPMHIIADRFDALLAEAHQTASTQFRCELPDLVSKAFGIPTGDDVIANKIATIVATPIKVKRRPGRPKGSKNKTAPARTVKASPIKTTTVKRKAAKKKTAKKAASKRKPTNGATASYRAVRDRHLNRARA